MRAFNNKELSRRVDEVLFYIWDPIGVSPEPCARAEYESYVPQVLGLLISNKSKEPISNYLAEITRTVMELSPDKNNCDEVAELLLEHKRAIKEGLA